MFYYKVKYIHSDGESTESGLVAASTYAEASQKVAKWYDDDDIVELFLYCLTGDNLLVLPETITLDTMKEWGY